MYVENSSMFVDLAIYIGRKLIENCFKSLTGSAQKILKNPQLKTWGLTNLLVIGNSLHIFISLALGAHHYGFITYVEVCIYAY